MGGIGVSGGIGSNTVALRAKTLIGADTIGTNTNDQQLSIVNSIEIDNGFSLVAGTHEYVIPNDGEYEIDGYVQITEALFTGRVDVLKEAFQFWIESTGNKVSPYYRDGFSSETGGVSIRRRQQGNTKIDTGQSINYVGSFVMGDIITLHVKNEEPFESFSVDPLSFLTIKEW